MNPDGYEAFDDPYCYKGTFVLKNRLGIRESTALEAFELEMSSLRADEPLPAGKFGVAHYRAIHRHLFKDVYSWAGRYRTVRTGKGGNWFCYPEYISGEMDRLFGRLADDDLLRDKTFGEFVIAAAQFLGELNAIHPFREGNGRAQLAFMHLLAVEAGHPLDLTRIRTDHFMRAMVLSFGCELGPLIVELEGLRST
jgi:cell filamentation protein